MIVLSESTRNTFSFIGSFVKIYTFTSIMVIIIGLTKYVQFGRIKTKNFKLKRI